MNNQYKVGDRVVCVKPIGANGRYGVGSEGTITYKYTHAYGINWDNGNTGVVVWDEIQPIKESNNMTEKTYTITLTELEAKDLYYWFGAIGGWVGCAEALGGTDAKTIRRTTDKMHKKLSKALDIDGCTDGIRYGSETHLGTAFKTAVYDLGDISIPPPAVSLSLNASYEAKVSKEGVRVQGELYSWDTVQALKDAVGKVGEGEWVEVGSVKQIVNAYAVGDSVEWSSGSDVWTNCSTIDYVPVGGKVRTRRSVDSVSVPVGSYAAVVTKDSIKIGCQTFPASIVDTLLANKPVLAG